MTNGVAKLYDRLDSKERVASLLLALIRGDDLETQRLNTGMLDKRRIQKFEIPVSDK